jgi:AcrR family transcriptional regulator
MTTTSNDKSSERPQRILNATLELVAAHGLLKTSMSNISKRAQSSPGIVYHYFESKDAIMQTLYDAIFKEMMAYILDNDILQRPILERYKGLWLRKYQFHFNNPDKTVFIEQFKNSSYYTEAQNQLTASRMSDLLWMGQADIDRGLIIDLPLEDIYTMTFTVALNLAKSHRQAGVTLDEATLDTLAERVCRSVLQ